jgi:hypothetical protein
VGVAISVTFAVDNLGSIDVTNRNYLQGGGKIEWGDGTKDQLDPVTTTVAHTYTKVGRMNIKAVMQGDYKWGDQGSSASCSYECHAEGGNFVDVQPSPPAPPLGPTKLVSGTLSADHQTFVSQGIPLKVLNPADITPNPTRNIVSATAHIDEENGTIYFIAGTTTVRDPIFAGRITFVESSA